MKSSDYTMRGHRIDKRIHNYRKSQLADPSVHELIPWCEVDSNPQKVHERDDVDIRAVAQYQLCYGCFGRQWAVPTPQ